jgi:hypothetical protein
MLLEATRRLLEGTPEIGASAVPAGGFAVRTRAASGHHLARKRTGLRGARWTGRARGGQNTRPSRVPGNVVLELSQRRLRLRWRVPRRSAGRRARAEFGALPRKQTSCADCVDLSAVRGQWMACAFRRSASLGFSAGCEQRIKQSSGAAASRERFRLSAPAERSGGG